MYVSLLDGVQSTRVHLHEYRAKYLFKTLMYGLQLSKTIWIVSSLLLSLLSCRYEKLQQAQGNGKCSPMHLFRTSMLQHNILLEVMTMITITDVCL